MRRYKGRTFGERYLANLPKHEVHDLDKETPACQIEEIIQGGHDIPFQTLSAAHARGYDNCAYCLGESSK